MSVTIQKIQEFYCGALKDAIHSEGSVHTFMYSLFGVMSTPTKAEFDSRTYWKESDPQKMNLIDKSLLCLGMTIEVLPAELNVIPYTVEFVNEAISSWSPHTRKAACLAIAVIADSECADKQCLQKLLPLVTMCMTDRHPAVRNAALCALGQFRLNREINLQHHYDELLVPLLHCLRLLSKPLKTSLSGTRSTPSSPYIGALIGTIVSLCSGKDGEMGRRTFGAYISKVIEYLLIIVNSSCDISIRELAVNAVKEIVRVSQKESDFYIHRFAKFLKTFLKIRPTADQGNIFVSLLEIFEMMERLADEDFKPLAKMCFKFITMGITIFRDHSVLWRAHKFLTKLRVPLDEEIDKNVVLQVTHFYESMLNKPLTGETSTFSDVSGSGLHKKAFEDSVSVKHEWTASPPLHFQEKGEQIVQNADEVLNKVSTNSAVSSHLDEIYSVDMSVDDINSHSDYNLLMCADLSSTLEKIPDVEVVQGDGPKVPAIKLEPINCEPPEKIAESVNIPTFDNSEIVSVKPDLGGIESAEMKGEAWNKDNQSPSKIASTSPQLRSDVTGAFSIQGHRHDENRRNSSLDATVPVVSDAGDLNAGEAKTGNNLERKRSVSRRRYQRSRSGSSSSYRRRHRRRSGSSSCSLSSRSQSPRRKRYNSRNSFGRIEFAHAEDARLAVRHGNDDSDLPYYNLSIDDGHSRRRSRRQDFDEIASNGRMNPQPVEESAFDILLKEAKAASQRK